MTARADGRPWKGQRVVVAGLGVTGSAATEVLEDLGAEVLTVDEQRDGPVAEATELAAGAELVVASPGWLPHHPLFQAAHRAGVPVISEIELAWRVRIRPDAPWLLVTGTNGKTTTTQMLAAMLRESGRTPAAVGNIGVPAVRAALDPQYDCFAVEISSFQLHYTISVEPRAAACLNVAQDHIDWHGSFGAYQAAKARVYRGVQSVCVYNAQDPVTKQMAAMAAVADGARAVGFTLEPPAAGQLGVAGGTLLDRAFATGAHGEARVLAHDADLAHLGPAPHLRADALAAAALSLAAGVDASAIAPALRGFSLDAHRLAAVAVPGAVTYIDDSKATNTHAAAAALAGRAAASVVWIAGGLTKGASFDELISTHRDVLRAVVLIGKDAAELEGALARHAPGVPRVRIDPRHTDTVMADAVAAARAQARPGDTVLLAPACASMDQFVSYAQRGDAFVKAVMEQAG